MDTYAKLAFGAIDAAFLKGLYSVDFSDLSFFFSSLLFKLSVPSSENGLPLSIP